MAVSEITFQIGKNGITPGVIDSLFLAFKNHKRVRVSLLKSSGRNRDLMKKIAEDISLSLSKKGSSTFSHKIIGFTIVFSRNKK